jgi:carboxyl-terminal processing protease
MIMKRTSKRIGRWIVGLALVAAVAGAPPMQAQAPAVQQVATADQLKSKAMEALLAGKFDQTSIYLSQAAELVRDDAVLTRLLGWARQFEEQSKGFFNERRQEYAKAVEESKLLQSRGYESYAVEHAARAYTLHDDKEAIRTEPWLIQLLGEAKRLAGESEKKEQWLKALKIYSALSAIEPEQAEWKEKLKTASRRVRLLAMYTPDELKKIQETENKEREAVDALLHPEKQSTAKPKEEEEPDQIQRVRWQDSLRGVQMDNLKQALVHAQRYYYRTVSHQQLMLGGLNSLRVVATTPALQQPFPGLADAARRNQFLGMLDAHIARVERMRERDARDVMLKLLDELKQQNEQTVQLPDAVLINEFGDGALSALDAFSNIIWPNEWEEFQKSTSGEFSGVGIQIQSDDSGNLKVVSPLEDSPAYRAGIKPDSIITHINGKSARWLNLNQAVKQITGKPGTTVTLTVKDPKGESRDYTLTRETIKMASVKGWLHKPGGGWDYMIDAEQKIGYLRLTNFNRTTTADLNRALDEMESQGVRGVLFDLRYNPGGLLNEAAQVVDKFIPKGVIVSTRPDRADSPYPEHAIKAPLSNDEKVTLPLVILVNQYSASASEIVSGALKDHHRAMVVGERTFGKGSVQMLYPLGRRLGLLDDSDTRLKLTTSHYYLPSNKCIHREENSREWGVEPDLIVEMTPEQTRAAIEARQKMDILRDAEWTGDQEFRSPLEADPQLSAALLLMRLQLNGGSILALGQN